MYHKRIKYLQPVIQVSIGICLLNLLLITTGANPNHLNTVFSQELRFKDTLTEGKLLISKSDCKICHHETAKLAGPSFKDVSEKYIRQKNAVSYLSEKIILGGAGVWGEVKMLPHPAISKNDAIKMAKYILSVN